MKQFGLELVWYGAGNAIFAHRLAAQLLGPRACASEGCAVERL